MNTRRYPAAIPIDCCEFILWQAWAKVKPFAYFFFAFGSIAADCLQSAFLFSASLIQSYLLFRPNSIALRHIKKFSVLCNLFRMRIVLQVKDLQTERGVFVKLSAEDMYQKYADQLFSIAFTVCQNREDAEDAVQNTLITYCSIKKDFESEEHIKAWLIRVAINRAKDIRSSFWRRNKVQWEEYMESLPFEEPEDRRLFEAVMRLKEKYRIVIHMYYYEDYGIEDIARILKCPSGTIKSRLSRARTLLKHTLKEEWNND